MTHAPNPTLRDRASFTLRRHLERIIMLNLAVYAVSVLFNGLGILDTLSSLIRELMNALSSSSFDLQDFLESFEDSFASASSGMSFDLEELQDMFSADSYTRNLSYAVSSFVGMIFAPLTELTTEIFGAWPTVVTGGLLTVGVEVLTCLLNTGLLYGMILLAQDTPVKCSVLICRWKHTLGCIGIGFWTRFKIALWALPGVGVMLLGICICLATFVGTIASESGSTSGMGFGLGLGGLCFVVGLILYHVLRIPAQLRFAMAPYAFAEKPSMGVYDAVEYSKRMTYGRKWQLFCLTLPYEVGKVGLVLAAILIIWLLSLMEAAAVITFLAPIMAIGAIVGFYYLGLLAQVATAHFYNEYKEKA